MQRVGIGYDVHRLVPGRALVLGGVTIPYERGLDGHSDADVLLHAVMDAMLGALALGDIGQHFPPGDPEYRDISSLHLLERVHALVAERGWGLVNVDVTVVAEAPRITPYADAMRRNLATATGVTPDRVSIKATTNEGLGFLGRQEGIAAMAVALLENGGLIDNLQHKIIELEQRLLALEQSAERDQSRRLGADPEGRNADL